MTHNMKDRQQDFMIQRDKEMSDRRIKTGRGTHKKERENNVREA